MSTDFSQARSALASALATAGPILSALQQADTVFGVLANAEKHKRMLETEVADHKSELESAKAAVAKSQKKLKDVTAEIAVAEADADARIKAVLAAEQQQVTAARNATALEQSKYAGMTAVALQASQDGIAKAQAASAAVVIELTAKEAALNNSIAALEKKLDALRASAQKFAAALTGE